MSTSVVEEVIEIKEATIQLNSASSSDAADKSSPVNENKHGGSVILCYVIILYISE